MLNLLNEIRKCAKKRGTVSRFHTLGANSGRCEIRAYPNVVVSFWFITNLVVPEAHAVKRAFEHAQTREGGRTPAPCRPQSTRSLSFETRKSCNV